MIYLMYLVIDLQLMEEHMIKKEYNWAHSQQIGILNTCYRLNDKASLMLYFDVMEKYI